MKNIELDNRLVEIVYAVLFICLFSGAFYISLSFEPPVLSGDPGAAFFPKLICTASLVFSIILFIQRALKARKNSGSAKDKTRLDLPPFLLNFFLVGGLILGMARLGSEISFFAFLFILLGLRTGRWLWAASIAVISTLVIYAVFVGFLNVRLPLLFLPKYINF